MTGVRRWSGGDSTLHRAIENAMQQKVLGRVVSESLYRRLIQPDDKSCQGLLVKEFSAPKGTRRLAAMLGHQAARREWRMLKEAHRAGCKVPRPQAAAHLEDGRTWVVMNFISGQPLLSALRDPGTPRQEMVRKLGIALARLHQAGFVHGDLHVGNWHVTPDGDPILLDLQRGRRTRSRTARIRDIGEFDFSLSLEGVSIGDRMRFRMSALGYSSPLTALDRKPIRAAGVWSETHGQRYFRRRTRHAQRPGRRVKTVTSGGLHGLRLKEFSKSAVDASIAAHYELLSQGGPNVLKNDHRAKVTRVDSGAQQVVVKEVTKTNRRRQFADRLRGSPARRAWTGGHGLLARGIASAKPLAFVEETRMGIPLRSLLILEDLHPASPVHELAANDPRNGAALSVALRRLIVALHRTQVIHGDLQAPHVFLRTKTAEGGAEARLEPTLIDLEGVRFPRQLKDNQRIQALVELNASITEIQIPGDERCLALELYAQALPFSPSRPGGLGAVLREIMRSSIARNHFWKGTDCNLRSLKITPD